MPLSKSGSYHANPAHARMHDGAQDPAAPEQPPVAQAHAVEIHHPNHPETGDGQNFHVRAHHADGSFSESKHPSLDEAQDAQSAHFGEAPEETDNEAEESDDAGESEGSDVDDEY